MPHSITYLPDGTRIDIGSGRYDYPLSIDLKITNYCPRSCPWCHESSGPNGNHARADEILSHLGGLPEGTEIALGGGDPLSHPDLEKIISGLRSFGYSVCMTVRDKDFDRPRPGGLKAVGVSLTPGHPIPSPKHEYDVAHMIVGINSIQDYREAKRIWPRILWLGFKDWGRNKGSKLPDISELRQEIVNDLYTSSPCTLAFDNLAISQLDLKSAFLKKEWDRFYLGQEFTCSMYVDSVLGHWSGSSTDKERVDWNKLNLIDYFRKYAKDN